MYGYYHDLKQRELYACQQELKILNPKSSRYLYVSERIKYLLSDLYELENKNRVYPTTG